MARREYFLLFLLFDLINFASCDVFGCGGFVKSDVEINYSNVEVKLYTPHGSIKYQTDCAPHTGYYLIPLYDKGDYVLKPDPPKGWGFEPESVTLKVDGQTDPCSQGQDINFRFTGFSLYGKVVSSGQGQGPAGVTLTLKSAAAAEAVSTTTSEGGTFSFSNVLPGDFTITASHSIWHFDKNEAKGKIVNDNLDIGAALSVAGYDLSGSVTGDGQPMKNVNFLIFSENKVMKTIPLCQNGAPKGFTTSLTNLSPLCFVSSGEDGRFVFPVVPSGEYFLVPYYKGEHIRFDVEPNKQVVSVTHGSAVAGDFKVSGFSVSGRVLHKDNGIGLEGVDVLLDGSVTAVTGASGDFNLDNMKTGSFVLEGRHPQVAFDAMTVEISPNTPQLPNLIAKGLSVCGVVSVPLPPPSLGAPAPRRLIYHPVGQGSKAKTLLTDAQGSFCQTLVPGSYVFKVHLTEAEMQAGLRLSPAELTVELGAKPVTDVTFSQLVASVEGSVRCMEACQPMEITLDPVARDGLQLRVEAVLAEQEASFVFPSVLPGKYTATIDMDNWCWKDRSLEVTVTESDVKDILFVHTSYILKCSVSHPITMQFDCLDKPEEKVGSFLLDQGMNRFCLAHPGTYTLTPKACHRFDQNSYAYKTSSPSTLSLTAVQHLVLGEVRTEVPVPDLKLTIQSSVMDTPTVIGPLPANMSASASSKAKDEKVEQGETVYSFEHWARTGESLTILAESSHLLFYPPSIQVGVSGADCPGLAARLTGRKGVFVEGVVSPPVAGVTVKVMASDNSMTPIDVATDAQGHYRVGPLHADRVYTVTAEREGYVMTEMPDKPQSFQAFKLGEISVAMQDAVTDAPLASVLLSLSGSQQYRSNQVTGEAGQMTFSGLSPGQYFLRPMMKEFRFDPPSQVIQVTEGTTENIVIRGTRVAFSCLGKVTSLNGEPEPGLVVEALGTGEACKGFQEESKTEADGSYRLWGLTPQCDYTLMLKAVEANAHVHRMLPPSRTVRVADGDLRDVHMVALRKMNHMDISGNIVTPSQHLPTLKVRLYAADKPDSPVHSIQMSKSTFFFFPTLTMDSSKSYILTVESSLSRFEYSYTLPSEDFIADFSYKHFTLNFDPKLGSAEPELTPGSVLLLPLLALAALMVYNHQALLPMLTSLVTGASSKLAARTVPSAAAPAQPPIPAEFMPSESSPARRKAKARKAQ